MSPITIRLRQYRNGFYQASILDRIRVRLNRVAFRVPFVGRWIPIRWRDLAEAGVWIVGTWVALVAVLVLDLLLN